MIYVILRGENRVLNMCDAWERDGEARMRREAHEAGWVPMESEITPLGNMIIWVE